MGVQKKCEHDDRLCPLSRLARIQTRMTFARSTNRIEGGRPTRYYLIANRWASGGHFAAGLGVIELTVALLLYQTPVDQLVWDVGHQPTRTRS